MQCNVDITNGSSYMVVQSLFTEKIKFNGN